MCISRAQRVVEHGGVQGLNFGCESESADILAQVARWLDDYCELEQMLDRRAEFSLRKLVGSKGGDPQLLAESVGKTLGIDEEPIRDMCGLLESCGMKVLRFVSEHIGPVHVLRQVLDETKGTTLQQCQEFSITHLPRSSKRS